MELTLKVLLYCSLREFLKMQKLKLKKKTYRILKISQLINTSKVTSEPLTPKNKKIKLLKFIYAGTFINLQK